MASIDPGVKPTHRTGDALHRHKSKSTRARPPHITRNSDTVLTDRTVNVSAATSSSPRQRNSRATSEPFNNLESVRHLDDDYEPYNFRDSVTSIRDDPFFNNYQTPQSVNLARELRSAAYSSRQRADSAEDGRPALNTRKISQGRTQTEYGMENINIAVIGAAGVGKSTLIQRALGLRTLPSAVASSLKMSVDSVVYTVSLIELDLETFDFIPDSRVQWPKQINGQIVPRVDGALILYDVMNRDSIADVPQTLNALVYSALPTILVSCKCDNPVKSRQIDTENLDDPCLAEVETVKTASNVPESARLCLGAMLRAIMSNRNISDAHAVMSRRRAASSANLEAPKDGQDARPSSQQSKHGRASSEYSISKGLPAPPVQSGRSPNLRSSSTARANLNYQYVIPAAHTAPPLSAHPAFREKPLLETSDDSESESSPPPPRQRTPKELADATFLNMDESDGESVYGQSEDLPILQRNEEVERPAKIMGLTFDELVDRLLGQQMSKADNNFSDIFLCLYRKFAAPSELFSAILTRLEQVAEDNTMHYLTRTGTQLRIITVIAKWVSSYPGDFASPQTCKRLDRFIEQLSTEPAFAAAAAEMRADLENHVQEDDDTGWAKADADAVSGENYENVLKKTTSPLLKPPPPTSDEPIRRERRTSEAHSMTSLDAPSSTGTNKILHTVEEYEAQAAKLIPEAKLPWNKIRFHTGMETTDDEFANEMTRIDWIHFSSIRIRDLVRHVSLPLEQKEKCKSLANVNRMIDHFNHIARWVANMILLRDKAKHRAIMLEKFMRIAGKLRLLNNYNGLAAVIAGINGTAVHRLSHTRELVSVEVQRKFMRLELLMSTQKSHFAYRLAWENSSLPRIPFVPLHRRDLVSAEEGSRTFVGPAGDRINWKKFEILAEVILPMMRSQGTPYEGLVKHEMARELVLDCRMPTDEEEIYQRSVQLEGTSAGLIEKGKAKFPWFQSFKNGEST